MDIIGFRKVSYIISGFLVLASIAALFIWGINLGIDFTGGSLLELQYSNSRPSVEEVKDRISGFAIGEVVIQPTGDRGIIVRMRDISEEIHQEVLTALRGSDEGAVEERFVSIGPIIGSELKRKAIYSLLAVIVMIILYIAWAFREVSRPVQSWKYGLVAIVALVHDVLIPTGVFAYLGAYKGVEINALFISALLTILGFSVHDTIVVFDRVRENLRKQKRLNFEKAINVSVNETLVRSINTSVTLLFVLFTLFFLGGESTKYFSLALIIGTFFGTYSSIFLASPLLVTLRNWGKRSSAKVS